MKDSFEVRLIDPFIESSESNGNRVDQLLEEIADAGVKMLDIVG